MFQQIFYFHNIIVSFFCYLGDYFVKENKSKMNPQSLKTSATDFFKSGYLQLEYLEIVDEKTLTIAEDWQATNVCCIAAYCNKVRLIDNIVL